MKTSEQRRATWETIPKRTATLWTGPARTTQKTKTTMKAGTRAATGCQTCRRRLAVFGGPHALHKPRYSPNWTRSLRSTPRNSSSAMMRRTRRTTTKRRKRRRSRIPAVQRRPRCIGPSPRRKAARRTGRSATPALLSAGNAPGASASIPVTSVSSLGAQRNVAFLSTPGASCWLKLRTMARTMSTRDDGSKGHVPNALTCTLHSYQL